MLGDVICSIRCSVLKSVCREYEGTSITSTFLANERLVTPRTTHCIASDTSLKLLLEGRSSLSGGMVVNDSVQLPSIPELPPTHVSVSLHCHKYCGRMSADDWAGELDIVREPIEGSPGLQETKENSVTWTWG